MKKHYLYLIFSLLLGTFLLLSANVNAQSAEKFKICHATASHSNPYGPKAIEVDNDSIFKAGHDGHDGPVWYSGINEAWGDIIPPFDYGDGDHYPGKNWTEEGQAILENDCQIPEEEYEQCSITGDPIYSDWSEWAIDPEDDTQEYRERTVSYYDSEDSEYLCSLDKETEYRDIEEEEEEEEEEEDGDVLGEKDVKDPEEVLGTTDVVMAETGASDNSWIYLVEGLLILGSLISVDMYTKRYVFNK